MIKLSQIQQDKLRGETGPYSEVNIKIEDRLLDGHISRQFITVYANINPLTYEVAIQNINKFDDNMRLMIQSADFESQAYGYGVYTYKEQIDYQDMQQISDSLKRAEIAKQNLRDKVLQLHCFVMELLGIEYKEE